MSDQRAAAITRNFLVLRGTRWLPTGLLIPVLVLLLIDRGLSLGQIGIAAAAQGLVVFLLELPTGGLADTIGRRPVLMLATVMEIVSLAVLLTADSVGVLVAVFVIQGVYRALESGPLDAWYVDSVHHIDPATDIAPGLARGGVVIGLSIAGGALLSAAIVTLDPIDGVDPLVVPVAVAMVLRIVDLGAIAMLMPERVNSDLRALADSVRRVPTVITGTVRLIRASTVLASLIAVEFVWGFGMTAFEALTPARLAEVTGSTSSAASLFGPAVTVASIASAVGAAAVPHLTRRIGPASAAMVLHVGQGAMVIGMAFAAGAVGVIVFYVLTLATHGALNPAYQTLLHRQADAARRTTVVSAASMAAHPGGALGGIVLGGLADRTSISTAMVVGAIALAAAAPLYLPARGQAVENVNLSAEVV